MSNEDTHPVFHGLMSEAYERWQANNEWNQDRFWMDLSYPERVAVFCGNLNYQVENGGFVQWHDNGYSACVDQLLVILKEIATPTALAVEEIVRRARRNIRAYERSCSATVERNRSWYADSDDDGEDDWKIFFDSCDPLDDKFYGINAQFLDDVEAFLKTKMEESK